jgi:hypothetical protein
VLELFVTFSFKRKSKKIFITQEGGWQAGLKMIAVGTRRKERQTAG